MDVLTPNVFLMLKNDEYIKSHDFRDYIGALKIPKTQMVPPVGVTGYLSDWDKLPYGETWGIDELGRYFITTDWIEVKAEKVFDDDSKPQINIQPTRFCIFERYATFGENSVIAFTDLTRSKTVFDIFRHEEMLAIYSLLFNNPYVQLVYDEIGFILNITLTKIKNSAVKKFILMNHSNELKHVSAKLEKSGL